MDAVKEQVNKVKETQLEIMKDKTGEGFEATWDEFTEVVDKFKKKDTKTYEFLINAGDKYKEVIFKLCQRIINNEEVPESF